jgi:GT2 family glycosyltransferase
MVEVWGLDAKAAAAGAQRVAIVVLNHNGKCVLLECLDRAIASDYQPFDLVVVDNGSTDGSAEAVINRFPRAHVVRLPSNRGVAGGRNAGIRYVQERLDVAYTFFLDNDAFVHPACLRELVETIDGDTTIGLVSPKGYRFREGNEIASAGMVFNPYTGVARDVGDGETDRGQYDTRRSITACPGFAFLVRREVFERIGPFDAAFHPYGWEDVDFSLRARKAGFKILYAPRAVVHHKGGKAGHGPIPAYERGKAENLIRLMKRHATGLQWICFLSLLPMRATSHAARELLRGNPGVFRDLFGGLSGLMRRKEKG